MSTNLLNYEEYNINELEYNTPKPSKGNVFLANIIGNRTLFQSPILKNMSGIAIDSKGCYIELELNENHISFINFLRKIDDFNVNYTCDNSLEWFNDKLPNEVIDDFYISTIQNKVFIDHKTGKKTFKNIFKCRIPTLKKKPNINIYNNNREIVNWERLQENTDTVALIELKGLRFLNNQLICDWEIQQLKTIVKKSNINLTNILSGCSKASEIESKSKSKKSKSKKSKTSDLKYNGASDIDICEDLKKSKDNKTSNTLHYNNVTDDYDRDYNDINNEVDNLNNEHDNLDNEHDNLDNEHDNLDNEHDNLDNEHDNLDN
jgi:hypothetical protein